MAAKKKKKRIDWNLMNFVIAIIALFAGFFTNSYNDQFDLDNLRNKKNKLYSTNLELQSENIFLKKQVSDTNFYNEINKLKELHVKDIALKNETIGSYQRIVMNARERIDSLIASQSTYEQLTLSLQQAGTKEIDTIQLKKNLNSLVQLQFLDSLVNLQNQRLAAHYDFAKSLKNNLNDKELIESKGSLASTSSAKLNTRLC